MSTRREFITLLGGAAGWPLSARAQQSKMPTIGALVIGNISPEEFWREFRQGLRDLGYIEGQNIRFEFRSAEGQIDRLGELAAQLVRLKVDVIVTWFTPTAIAAKQATRDIPIVMAETGDPIGTGLIASLPRPGGNVTGVSWFSTLIAGKALGLLHELIRNAALIAVLVNPRLPEGARTQPDAHEAARVLGRQLLVLNASTPAEIDAAFAAMREKRAGALFVGGDPFFSSRVQQIVALAARDAIPAMYTNREFVEQGGLMCYGNDIADAYRRVGVYVGRILNGALPADLPIDQATKFEFVINLRTAKALGLTIPNTVLIAADEVIE
jgi:putative ABC transport system substrate-binding protein